MVKSVKILIQNGTIKLIYDDVLLDLISEGDAVIKRASHVEPQGTKWIADMSPSGINKILGPFNTREEALNAEKECLEINNFGFQ